MTANALRGVADARHAVRARRHHHRAVATARGHLRRPVLTGRTGNPSPPGVKSRFAAIMEPTRDGDYFLMTTNTEQRQAIWYVTGLAEVLAGPGSQDQSDDAIVQFDRYRQTRTPSPPNASPNTLSHTARRRLDQWG